MSQDNSDSEERVWISREDYEDLPAPLQMLFVSLRLVPADWAPSSLTGYGAPEWTAVPATLGYAGWISPVGLGPAYTMSSLQRAMRAGYAGDYGLWMYQTRQAEALQTATGYAARQPTPYAIGMQNLYEARASYWAFQQAATPAYEGWSALKLASYYSPQMWGVRGLGFAPWQFGTQVGAGAAMSGDIVAALAADPTLLGKVQTQAAFWPYQYPSATGALYHGGIEWSLLHVAGWAITGGVRQTLRQAGPVGWCAHTQNQEFKLRRPHQEAHTTTERVRGESPNNLSFSCRSRV